MSIHCFQVPTLQPEPGQSELNAFVAQSRVLSLHREFVADGASSFWAFCVDVADGPGPLPDKLRSSHNRAGGSQRDAVDYKLVLSPEDFVTFAGLRDLRKTIAQREGGPVYGVFTNAQLAALVQGRVATKAQMASVEGVGPARVEKYATEVLAWLEAHRAADAGDATNHARRP